MNGTPPSHEPERDALAAAWRAASDETPPPALDDAIRAAARRTAGSGPSAIDGARGARKPRDAQWWPFAAAAAIAVIAFGIVRLTPEEVRSPMSQSVTDVPAPSTRAPDAASSPAPTPTAPAVPPASTSAPTPPERDMAAERKEAPARPPRAVASPKPAPATASEAPVANKLPAPAADAMKSDVATERTADAPAGAAAETPAPRSAPAPFPAAAPAEARAAAPRAAAVPSGGPAVFPFDEWIARIRAFVRDDRMADARRELQRLRDAYPARVDDIPAELRALLPADQR